MTEWRKETQVETLHVDRIWRAAAGTCLRSGTGSPKGGSLASRRTPSIRLSSPLPTRPVDCQRDVAANGVGHEACSQPYYVGQDGVHPLVQADGLCHQLHLPGPKGGQRAAVPRAQPFKGNGRVCVCGDGLGGLWASDRTKGRGAVLRGCSRRQNPDVGVTPNTSDTLVLQSDNPPQASVAPRLPITRSWTASRRHESVASPNHIIWHAPMWSGMFFCQGCPAGSTVTSFWVLSPRTEDDTRAPMIQLPRRLAGRDPKKVPPAMGDGTLNLGGAGGKPATHMALASPLGDACMDHHNSHTPLTCQAGTPLARASQHEEFA